MKLTHIPLIAFFAWLYLFSNASIAQETRFFVPLEIQKAYEKGTRSYDGNPGANYWQNTADYTIDVTVYPKEKRLEGKESIVYHNNSPDNLQALMIRLYADVYKKGSMRYSSINDDDVFDGVEIKSLVIDDESYPLSGQGISRQGTHLLVRLKKPVATQEKVHVSMEWSQIIPVSKIRNGVYDSTSFFVGYWYPQIAVYDDIFGWDGLDYNLRTEMYNDLANFDVKVTVPESFLVWATGELQNGKEVLPKKVFKRFEEAKTSDETIAIISGEDLKSYTNNGKPWHFKAREVTDFAFCLSDHYQWKATSLKLGDRRVLINSAYSKNAEGEAFDDHTQMQRQAMKVMSEDFPGIEYPYPVFTTFVGEGNYGMEYPMMANNGNPFRGVTVHEMLHTYFPMYVRINEKRFAWMDEGWAQFNTAVLERYYFEDSKQPYFTGLLGASGPMGSLSDLPLITSSQFMDNSNYGYSAYPLPAFIYGIIYDELGHDVFLECYRGYIRRWAKKSPTPYDFFYTFENISKKDLSHIWKPWFFEFGYSDVTMGDLQNGTLTLVSKGNKVVPVVLDVKYEDQGDTTLYVKAGAWDTNRKMEVPVPNHNHVQAIIVNKSLPDAEPTDNFYPSLREFVSSYDIDDEILGSYLIEGPNFVLEVVIEEGLYKAYVPGGTSINLIPVDSQTLQTMDGNLTLGFTMEENKPASLEIKGAGPVMKGTKQK